MLLCKIKTYCKQFFALFNTLTMQYLCTFSSFIQNPGGKKKNCTWMKLWYQSLYQMRLPQYSYCKLCERLLLNVPNKNTWNGSQHVVDFYFFLLWFSVNTTSPFPTLSLAKAWTLWIPLLPWTTDLWVSCLNTTHIFYWCGCQKPCWIRLLMFLFLVVCCSFLKGCLKRLWF